MKRAPAEMFSAHRAFRLSQAHLRLSDVCFHPNVELTLYFPMLLLLLQRSMFIQILCFVEKRAAARQPRTFARLWQRASNQHHTALQLGVNYKSNIIIFFFSCKRATAPTTVHRLSVYHHRLHGPTSQSTFLLSREKRKEKKKIIKNFCCCPMCKLKV